MNLNPTWVAIAISITGLLSNALWTTINLRIENKILKKFDELKDWAEDRFVMKPDISHIARRGGRQHSSA